jgi:hypothetical protein
VVLAKAARKYLDRYAEREARLADALGSYGHALVVPAYGEGDLLVAMLRTVPRGPSGDVLVVLVVNGKPGAPPWVHEQNRAVVARLADAFGTAEEIPSIDAAARLFELDAGRLLVVDRFMAPRWFPDGQGVGLARKIGVDLCARLRASGRLRSPFVHTTDADVELPPDYFARPPHGPAAALLYPFSHRPDDDEQLARAVLLYEISLRYYVLGLRFAGSPYAFHTIGSTIATDVDAYMKVRGFPRRDAAEDFYLLSKLAKVGPIIPLSGAPIAIRGRVSSRVPFGTGAAVGRIVAEGAAPFTMYEPAIFRYVRAWLGAMGDVDRTTSERALDDAIARRCEDEAIASEPLIVALRGLGAPGAVTSAQRSATSVDALRRRLVIWFDAFRTLKLVHLLQRAGMHPLDWFEALVRSPFAHAAVEDLGKGRHESPPELTRIVERLADLERAHPLARPSIF